MYKVQEVAKIAGVSVRTLHHYDSIDLMKPSNKGSNRYRYYSDEDLKLLQQILFLKELGFSLKKIQEIIKNGYDADYAMARHIELLEQKKFRIEQLIGNARTTQQEFSTGEGLSNEQRFAAFSIHHTPDRIDLYQKPQVEVFVTDGLENITEEAAAVSPEAESAKPEKEAENPEEIDREANRIYRAVANLMHLPPSAPAVQQEMVAYYHLLDRFYECTPNMFRNLGNLYANDSRFSQTIDQHGNGLSAYLKDAMHMHAESLQHV
ncbi:MerR family transcriptional regulator [Planococcus sp. ISL-109]|uniref:MerR family transcriptional regulator n=1 Tax=Planococcus sp. ISL-109 TaxID=2819166 RepID=UPI001BE5E4CC|nr:MerR family transcriptional regulator [Planococcus sp. ISL-109]MBT2583495.1 MerR family transcriptional regulator [Planococcus sp. ISL-109]